MKKFMEEFKSFALKGNVLDMAVGVIIGSAFSAIVKSLVDDIIMPLLGILLGQINISELAVTVPNPLGGADVSLRYGLFLQNILNFIFIALAVFMIVKAANAMMENARKKEEEAPAETPEPSKEELLLTEIRDVLKEMKQ
ncbi:large conductance mechanosensitive channel [Fusobacterium naviforme]|nr:large-conductance mechanosensitive channel protein MscL [Fusobacterium naviforme]PSL09929.1 large conductance mechanosensitive channel [Fusobacterium naviforme]STO27893.1 Large-conductance mechanosensitive channel [Fusobacterium naviforme]